ncbi:uncharacterized protein B4U80_08263 [Leptotrombidium deliense]|uniref:G-protein coupled receptors family 3 profile domain-containing protein n=1 Tax=Leptotrombidium deliense TaxID=299467 RepID=A0A443S9F0_9ACAR|nr:uncharacterized protein B4U80_08263 [Leptotrombidium deliense]
MDKERKRSHASRCLIFVCTTLLAINNVLGNDLNGQCLPHSSQYSVKTIEENADITIGVILNVHETGSNGVYDCGNVTREGITVFEALEWVIGLINQESGAINGNLVTESFIPGIKLGVKVCDACNHRDVSVRHLTKLYPIIESGTNNCYTNDVPELQTVGVLDKTDISLDPAISKYSQQNFIPLVSLSHKSAVPPDTVGKVLAQIMHDLEWSQIVVLHENDEHSIHVVKMLGQIALSNRICLVAVNALPTSEKSIEDMTSFFNSITSQTSQNIPIFVIGNGVVVNRLIDIMLENVEISTRFQWLFTTLPEPEAIRSLAQKLSANVYALAAYPGSISMFEDFWQQLQLPTHNVKPKTWFDEFVEFTKKCEGSNCLSKQLPEAQIDVLWRTHYSLPAIHSVFTFAHALRNAWLSYCHGSPGFCPRMKQLSRRDFVTLFLEPIQFEHSSMARSPPEVSGRKSEKTRAGEIEGLHLSIVKFEYRGTGNVDYAHIIVYDTATETTNVINDHIGFKPSPCPQEGCHKCVKVRQSRIDDNKDLKELDSIVQSQVAPQISANFKKTWGMITSTFSGIGVMAVLACGVYFLMLFPITVGTTVLGYFILLGLFTLFSVNFLFLIPVDFPICWLRRFGMPVAYSIMLSGMLVKVMNTWRLMSYRYARVKEMKLTSACALLFIAIGLVLLQLIVTTVWLFIYPPKPGFHDGVWSCSQNNINFIVETESVVSLMYIMLLLVITIFFAALTWKCCENNHEPRYIMFCCIGMATTWIIWTIFASLFITTRVSREMTIICVNLFNAALIMITLFLRKLYIYRKLLQKARSDRDYKKRLQPSSFPGSMYGTVHKTNPIVWDNQANVDPIYGKRNATRPPFETDQIDDGASSCGSTTGSVQVQAEDLYPMEVYDGGSQFQAVSSLFNANSNRSVYLMDDSTYIR